MKHGLWVLATCLMASAVYAQTENSFSRQEVLDIFAQYNPSVLERAKQNPDYNAVLEDFLTSYLNGNVPADSYEVMAIARNFDNSINLQILKDIYAQLWLTAKLTGGDITPSRELFTKDVADVVTNIWAVTTQLRQVQLDDLKNQRRALKKDDSLTEQEKQVVLDALNDHIKSLKTELKSLKKNAGEQIISSAEEFVAVTEADLTAALADMASQAAAAEAENLQVKSNHKKPVAK